MSISNHLARTPKLNIVITTVDPSKRDVRGVAADGYERMIAIYDLRGNFRWPVEGETWTIYQENGMWFLGAAWEAPDTPMPITSLGPGDGLLGGPGITYFIGTSIQDAAGQRVPFVNTTGVVTDLAVRYDPITKRFYLG